MSDPRATAEAWAGVVLRHLARALIAVGLIAGSVYVLFRLRPVITTVFVATILAYVMRPIAGWLARRRAFRVVHDVGWLVIARVFVPRRAYVPLPMRIRRVIATLYVLVVLLLGGWYAGKYLVSPFTSELQNVQENWESYRKRIAGVQNDLRRWYALHIRREYRQWLEAQVAVGDSNGAVKEHATAWLGIGIKRTGEYVNYIVEIVLLPVLAFYFAVESRPLKHEFVGMLPRRRRREVLRMIGEFNEIMFSFVIGQAILCLIAGVVVGVGLGALGVPYPVTLGVLAGLTRAIPIIGPILGGIPIVLLALATKGYGVGVGVLIFFTILHFTESKFIMPLLIGERLKLHPVVIIIVLLVGQEFGGLLGMFFAAPVAALARVIVRRYWLRLGRARHALS